MKKKKKLWIILGVVLLVLAGTILWLGLYLGPIIKRTVNTVGPEITGTKVEVASVGVSILGGKVSLDKLFVGNPEGWQSEKVLSLETVRLDVKTTSLFSDYVRINEITIEKPEIVYESNQRGGSNIKSLLAQIDANIGHSEKPKSESPKESTPEPEETQSSTPKKFSVKHFKLEGAKVIVIAGEKQRELTLPTITFDNLGVEQGGITVEDLTSILLKHVLNTVGDAAVRGLLDPAKQDLIDALQDPSKQSLKDAGKKTEERLKGLLKK